MKKSMTISYEVGNNLYLNFTNKCPCACTFCIRNNSDGAYGSDPLWLEHEPTMEEITADLDSRDIAKYDEIVFCGFGEPTERLDAILAAAEYLRKRPGCPALRLNTNGLGDLVNGRNIAPELCKALDTISISLNASNEESYNYRCRPGFEGAYQAMLDFVKECKGHIPEITVTVVDIIPDTEIKECRRIAEELGVNYRVRIFS